MKVVVFEDVLKVGADTTVTVPTDSQHSEDSSSEEDVPKIPLGRRKSGRVWKYERKRASSLVKTRGLRISLESKWRLRDQLRKARRLSQERKEERLRLRQEKKERRQENLRRQEENRRKAEIVQVIRNTSKIKRMKKKQLRKIEKRDTNNAINE